MIEDIKESVFKKQIPNGALIKKHFEQVDKKEKETSKKYNFK